MKNIQYGTKVDEILKAGFTLQEYALIVGTLLGDAHLNCRGPRSYRLKIEHGVDQKEYCCWKRQQLIRLCQNNKDVSPAYNSKKRYTSFRFYTDSNIKYKRIHEIFYTKVQVGTKTRFVKTITEELLEYFPIDPLVVAVLFMDDGSVRADAYSGKLATQGFSREEQVLIQKWLFDCFSLKTNIIVHKESKKQYYISIPADQFGKLVDLVKPIIVNVPTLRYKLNEERKERSKNTNLNNFSSDKA